MDQKALSRDVTLREHEGMVVLEVCGKQNYLTPTEASRLNRWLDLFVQQRTRQVWDTIRARRASRQRGVL